MGEIVGAALVAHVPTIVLPEADRYELNEGKEISLVPGMKRLREEYLDPLEPETIIVLDSHWFTTVETVVTSAKERKGFFTSSELPRGMSSMPYDLPGDPELAEAIANAADDIDQCWVTPVDNEHLPTTYATVNVAEFLQRDERWISISSAQTGEPLDFLNVGACIAQGVAKTNRRVVLLASGAMSHTFWSLRQLRNHEASDPVHIFSKQAADADRQILSWWAKGDHRSVIENMDSYAKFRPEARFAHYLSMVGAIGAQNCHAIGRAFSDYENSIGTGQIHVAFDRPVGGWTKEN
jgi:aromatic ring-opening dioxygenase catalytic subunit (LigB family)